MLLQFGLTLKSDKDTMEEDKTTIQAIHRLMLELAEMKGKMKTIKDQLKDVAEQNDEYRALEEELKEVSEKRATAKKLLEADKDYQLVNSELEELKFKFKDLQEIMSHHLVTYFSETNETQLTTPDGETMQVVVSAKLGKEVSG
jgi:predicted  nucleic acid-binding Zn-ribbon protein